MNSPATTSSAALIVGLLLALPVSPAHAAEPTALIGHQKSVVDVEFARDGQSLASIAADGDTILWDLAAGTGRRGPKVNRDFWIGGAFLQFTSEARPLLMAGCDTRGFVLDPQSMATVAEWDDPRTMRQYYPLIYVGGRRFVKRAEVLEAGQQNAIYPVGERSPPLSAASPDGSKWLTDRNIAAGDRQIHVIEAATGRLLCDLKAFTARISGIAWAGNSRVLTLIDGGQYGGSLMLWDVSGNGKLLAKVDVPGGWRLTASENGTTGAVALREGKISLVEIGDRQLRVRSTVNAGLWSANEPTFALSRDGMRLLAGSPSDPRWQLVVLDAVSGREMLVSRRKQDDALPELAPGGESVAVGHADGTISLLPVAPDRSQPTGGPLTGILDRPLDQPAAPGMRDGIRNLFRGFNSGTIAMSRGGEVIVVGNWLPDSIASVTSVREAAKHLPVWETTSTGPWKKELPTWAVLADGAVLVEGTIVGSEKIPNIVSGRINPATGEFQLKKRRNLHFTAMQPSPDGKLMAVRACEWKYENFKRVQLPASLILLDMQTGEVQRTLATGLETATPCRLVFSGNSQRLAVLDRWKLRVFETATGEELPLAGEWKPTQFWFLDEGRILARREGDGSIVGVDLDTQAEAFRWNSSTGQSGQVTAVEISLDGRLAAVGGTTGDLTLRNPRTGEVLHRTKPMELPIGGLGFSPDGSVLAAADEQRRLMAWKIGTFEKNDTSNAAGGPREIHVQK